MHAEQIVLLAGFHVLGFDGEKGPTAELGPLASLMLLCDGARAQE